MRRLLRSVGSVVVVGGDGNVAVCHPLLFQVWAGRGVHLDSFLVLSIDLSSNRIGQLEADREQKTPRNTKPDSSAVNNAITMDRRTAVRARDDPRTLSNASRQQTGRQGATDRPLYFPDATAGNTYSPFPRSLSTKLAN
uniref:Uncharacterized protein n=1 Tax=Plectus sambesii TaxID=2011161 RepID=A0A914V550_9BILA